MKKRVWTARAIAPILLLTAVRAEKFYRDDPLQKEPVPSSVGKVRVQKLNELVDFYVNTAQLKGERHSADRVYPSGGTNTLGEVMSGAWFTNRHDRTRRMTPSELARGPNEKGPPDSTRTWTIIAAKAQGIQPGFTISDGTGRDYFLKFDPPSNPEIATSADVICAKFLYAIGYHVPENYIVYLRPEQLKIKSGVKFDDPFGRFRVLQPRDVTDLLSLVAKERDGRVRAVASLRIPGEGVGNFKYYGRRPDDPNEFSRHEHLRVLRGLFTFAAWLNQTDAKGLNTYDAIVEQNGKRFIRHYLIDFGSALGSAARASKEPRTGHEYYVEPMSGLLNLITLGIRVEKHDRISYPANPAIGRFSAKAFDPEKWKPNYPNVAFQNRLPGDDFWAAKKLAAFTDEDIRAIVRTGDYTDPGTAEELATILIARRDLIVRQFISKLMPLDNFRVQNGRLEFDDLTALCDVRRAVQYSVRWSRLNNQTGALTPVSGDGWRLPTEAEASVAGAYWAAVVSSRELNKRLTVYVRREADWKVVGVERDGANSWEPRS